MQCRLLWLCNAAMFGSVCGRGSSPQLCRWQISSVLKWLAYFDAKLRLRLLTCLTRNQLPLTISVLPQVLHKLHTGSVAASVTHPNNWHAEPTGTQQHTQAPLALPGCGSSCCTSFRRAIDEPRCRRLASNLRSSSYQRLALLLLLLLRTLPILLLQVPGS